MNRTRFSRLPSALCTSLLALSLAATSLAGCTGRARSAPDQEKWADLRNSAQKTNHGEQVAHWLLAEMLRPGGQAKNASTARKKLDQINAQGVIPSLARGMDDAAHGQSSSAADHFFEALKRASGWDHPEAGLYAWYAALRAQELAPWSRDFTKRHRADIEALLQKPGHLGFRAYSVIVEFWADNAFDEAEQDIDEKMAAKLGCENAVALAGPFGTNSMADMLRAFPPERAGFWPERWSGEEGQHREPRQLEVETAGCAVVVDESVMEGIFYAQTFLELEQPHDLILTAGGASQMWVNDKLVLDRDLRVWGSWPKIAAQVSLPKGRHRVVWKTRDAQTTFRVLTPDGRAAKVRTSRDQYAGYSLVPPRVLNDPNELSPYLQAGGPDTDRPELSRFIAAYLADDDGSSDIAAVIFEPFVEKVEQATGLSLSTAAIYVHGDPIYDENQTRDLVHELQVRAVQHDPKLWYPKYQNIIWDAEQKGPTTVVSELEAMAKEFPDVPTVPFTLAELYEQLGWGPEYEQAVRTLMARFPDDEGAIKLAIDYYESDGQVKKVDELLARLLEINPDSELLVTRALNRKDYDTALSELKRLQARRPGRKDIEERVDHLLVRSGNKQRTMEQLQNAIEREPRDAHARLALADAELASGRTDALSRALVESISAGADPSPINGAIDLIEGLTALEPYRLDGLKVIEEYEARNIHMPGTAARVLDYGAVWVNPDGSSRFLEHEIVRIQSEEAISRFAEESGHGLVLRLRVIKKDGTTLEPEEVSGKPTVTMPHLELGDYIETERILSQWGDGVGEVYVGPGWYFREADVAYARSEFLVIAPAEKQLILEPHNGVPEPTVTQSGSLVTYRYRVDNSPAAVVEPMSPPAQEFLPRVSVGWGLSFERRLQVMTRNMITLAPVDPRIVKIAENITKKNKTDEERVRELYHWVLDSIQDGEEQDGRRVVVSRNGNRFRGFETLCRALGISVRWAVAESKLASPITGTIDSAERPLAPLLAIQLGKQRQFLTIEDKFAPFGTVPSSLRGENAYLLGALEVEKTIVPMTDGDDGIGYEGQGTLNQRGDLKIDLKIIFNGSYAASLRNGLSQIPENQLGNVIESRLLAQQLPGARLISHKVLDKEKLDQPLIIQVETEVPHFASETSVGLLINPPFMPRLSQLTTLATRVTPLLIGQDTRQTLRIKISLPPGTKTKVETARGKSAFAEYSVADEANANTLTLVREVVTHAGRVAPAEYPAFQLFTNQADAALGGSIRLVPGK